MTNTPKLCFVIMPFSEERMEVFTHGISPACKHAGFEAVRVDQLKGHFNINRKIIEHLFGCDVVIAEITDKNPNVFYEMGVAHCLGNKTIMIAQDANDLPFDIRNYRCLIYKQTAGGLQKLQEQIVESLQEIDNWGKSPSNPVQDFKPEEVFIPKSKAELLRRQLEQQVRENEKLMRNSIAPVEWQKLQAEHQRAQSELKTKEQDAAQQVAEMQALQKEVERLRALVPVSKPAQAVKPKLQLRAAPMAKLSVEEATQMLRDKNFFDKNKHASGSGLAHKYERVERGGEQLVIDHATGLTWQQAGSADAITYAEAEKYIRDLNKNRLAGYEDWRLPTLEEAMSLMEREQKNGVLYIAPEFDLLQQWIWTSDKENFASEAWVVAFNGGLCGSKFIIAKYYVRAVR